MAVRLLDEPRQQAAEDSVADDENTFERRAAERVQGGRRQSQQHRALAKCSRDWNNTGSRGNQM